MVTQKQEYPINGVGIQNGGILSPLLPKVSIQVAVLPHHQHVEEMRIHQMRTPMLSGLTVVGSFPDVGKYLIILLHRFLTFVLVMGLLQQRVAVIFKIWMLLTNRVVM